MGQVHCQVYEVLFTEIHVPPFAQGKEEHGLNNIGISHLSPIKSSVQLQLYVAIPSTHVPPLRHSIPRHSLMLV